MNKFINALLLFFLFPTMGLTIFVGFDLPIEILKVSGGHLPYRKEAFLAFGLILFLINLRRSIRKWMGIHLILKVNRFSWNKEVSSERKNRIVVYSLLESFVMFVVAYGLYTISKEAIFPAIGLVFGGLDGIIFLVYGLSRKAFRLGITSKAVILADREVNLIYFSGLRKISIHQDSIFFDYIKGLQLNFPSNCIAENEKDSFFENLKSQLDTDRVFITTRKD
jgi:hypothetical protein